MIEQEEAEGDNGRERNQQDDAAKSGRHSATTATALTFLAGHESGYFAPTATLGRTTLAVNLRDRNERHTVPGAKH